MEIFKAVGISKVFKNSKVLNNIYMTISQGDIYGFIGPNGAGKTTLIKILCGLSVQTEGSFTLFGKEEEKDVINERKKLGILVEQPALIQGFTCYQNLKFQSLLLNISNHEEKITNLLELVDLTAARNKKAKKLSLGMKQRLAIAMALLNNPEFLVLDEPINGLDPTGIIEVRELLLKLNRENNITILISSHFLGELANLVTKVGLINHGRILEEQSFSSLIQKCQNKIRFDTVDNEKAKTILSDLKINTSIENNRLSVTNYQDKTIKLISVILNHGIEIIDFTETKGTLEDYYIKKIAEDNLCYHR